MELYEIGNTIAKTTVNAAVAGGLGYLSIWAFTSLNPLLGGIFGASYVGAGLLLNPVFDTENSTTASKLLGTVLKAIIAAAIAFTALGVAFSLAGTLILTITALYIPIAITTVAILTAAIGYVIYKQYQHRQEMRQLQQQMNNAFSSYRF